MKLMKHLFSSLFIAGAMLSTQALAEEKTSEQAQPQTSEIQKALIGIGAKKAEAIVQYREKHGNFTVAEQLLEVQGIGKATLEKNRDRIVF
ncbi:MAG: helix-hairpin-helix domain-containing protein [Haemophilus parainfluenzae]|nr:helix-hairpin-helix domain-containing protein [Haemophilus parainfluenzae]